MRRPSRQRSVYRARIDPAPDGVDLSKVAKKATFVGSVEHKDAPSFAGLPRPRSDCEICPQEFCDRQIDLTRLLRDSIRKGFVGGPWENGFPRYAWCKKDGRVFQGRLTNQTQGHYKGWPISNSKHWPEGI